MDDLISRQAAIDALDINRNPVFNDSVDYEGAMYDICKLPSAQPEQRWIPCSERLPDEDYCTGANHQYSADVLITAHNADDEKTIIDYGHTLDGAWYSDTIDCIVPSGWEVIAWMPLPEPYKGEEA